jgi:hypothetical protein
MITYALVIALALTILPVSAYAQIIINEVELYPSVSYERQWVELFNTSNFATDLSGWTVTSLSKNMTLTVPQGTMVNGSGYFIVKNSESWMEQKDEVIILKDQLGNVIDQVGPFTETDKDSATWQRYPNGEDNWRFLLKTPGKSNGGFPTLKETISRGVELFSITKISLIDRSGTNTTLANVNEPLKVSATIESNSFEEESFTYIVKITNSEGITVQLSWVSGMLKTKKSLELSQQWIPESIDNYEIEFFVWKDVADPTPLSFNVPRLPVTIQ